MSLCILVGAETIILAVAAFTLSWTHSVEKTRWEEDWRVAPAGLKIAAARVHGSGAGMEPPDGAVLVDGWWTYSPGMPEVPELFLAASGATGGGWSLCAEGRCTTIGAASSAPIRLWPCGDSDR